MATTVGKVSAVYCLQNGHWRSANSISVTGALGLPSVMPLCGMPFRSWDACHDGHHHDHDGRGQHAAQPEQSLLALRLRGLGRLALLPLRARLLALFFLSGQA